MPIGNNNKPNIILIGGAGISIENRPEGQLQFGPENPGTISVYCRDKAWQMASDLLNDGCGIEFVSVAGNDFAGQAMKAQLNRMGVGVEHFHLIDGKDTAVRHEILNLLDQPEMEFQNGDVFACMTKKMIDLAANQISSADCIVLETHFPKEIIQHIVASFPQVPILLMPDSEEGAEKAKSILGGINGILTGRREAEVLSGLSILSEEELLTAVEWFYDKGIGQVFLDLSFGGVCHKDAVDVGVKRPGPIRPASVVDGFVRNKPAAETATAAIQRRE